MYDSQRDSSTETAPGCFYWLIWLLWAAVTVVTFLLGESLRQFVVGLINPQAAELPRVLSLEGRIGQTGLGALEIAAELAGGLASGLVIAAGQAALLYPFIRMEGALEWVAATTLGRAAAWLAIYIVSQEMVRLVLDKQIAGLCVLFIVLGGVAITAGVALGYAQAIVFRRRVAHPGWWVLANIPGFFMTAVLIMFALYIETENTVREFTTPIVAAITGFSTGIALMELLRQPTYEAEWRDMFRRRARRRAAKIEEVPSDTVLGSSFYEPRKEE